MTIEPIDIKNLTDDELAELFNQNPGPAEEGTSCLHDSHLYLDAEWARCSICYTGIYELGQGNPNWF